MVTLSVPELVIENLAEHWKPHGLIQKLLTHGTHNVATTSEPDVATASEHEQSSVNDTTNSGIYRGQLR